MIKFIKKYSKLFEVILLFFLSLTPLLWLKDNQIILGHDSGFRLDPIQHLVNLFYSWDPSSNFGTDWSLFKGFIVTQAPEAFFISVTNSFVIGQKLTFIFWFFSIGISMYIFVNSFFKEKDYWFFRIFASTFYMYNFFLLQGWFIVERAKFSLFILLPLGLVFVYKTLTKEYSILKGAILFSLISFFFNAGGNATFYGTLLVTYGISFVVLTAINVRKSGYRELLYSFKVGIFFAISFLAVNSYWVLPQVYSFISGWYNSNLMSVGGIESIIAWESVITQYASFINLLRLQGMPDWYDNNLHTYATYFVKNPFLVALSFIPLVILLFGVFYHKKLQTDKKNSELIILMLLFLLFGLFFTAGSHPPFGAIYISFVKFIPGFAIFRSAFYKFGGVLWFSYIFLVSYYISLILLKFSKRKIIYVFIGLFSFIFVLGYHFPFFNGNFFTWYDPFTTKVKLPYYVNDMAEYINKLSDDTRILLLPEFANNADSYRWGFWGIDSLPRLVTNKSIVANNSNNLEIVNSIYYAISQKNENLFLHLVGISGINRLLWRDDVLYSDKTTTSESLMSIKENLESFKGIKVEKEIGAWTLYNIKAFNYAPTFYSTDAIVYAKSDLPKLRNIFSEVANTGNPAILLDEAIRGKNMEILSMSNIDAIAAECIACGSDTFNPAYAGLPMPQLRILPNSPFYYILNLREEQVEKSFLNSPKLRIDAALGHSSKRIVEMKEIANAKLKEDDPRLFVRQSIRKYESLINDAVSQSANLTKKEENAYLIKILSYINSHFYFLSTQRNLYDYALEDFEKLSVFMQEEIRHIRGKIWASDLAQNIIRYFLSVEESDIYDIHVPTEVLQPESILLDGRKLETKSVSLGKGVHELELSYPTVENLVDIGQGTQSGELRLAFGDRMKFGIKNFNQRERYFVTFDYKILHGKPNAAIAEQGRNGYVWNLYLNQNVVWNSLNYVFVPSPDTKSANLEFFPTGFETTGAIIEIKNLKVIKAYIPEVFISRHVSPVVKIGSPKISFSKLNKTAYNVNIGNANEPFLLVFGEAYSEGWRAYIVENSQTYNFLRTFFSKPISQVNHYPLNGYSNGWLVNKRGNYSIIVEYFPQKIFYIGIGISMISFGAIIILWIRRRKYEQF